MLATLHALRALGVRISMDDFGTGYSSLSYLRSFPFDKIKIDRSFVHDLGANPDSQAIVRAIISLGSSLGITITAGGRDRARPRSTACRRMHPGAGLFLQRAAAGTRDHAAPGAQARGVSCGSPPAATDNVAEGRDENPVIRVTKLTCG